MAACRLITRFNIRLFPHFNRTCHQIVDKTAPIEAALQAKGFSFANPTNLRKITSCLLERGAKTDDLIKYFAGRPELINTQQIHWVKTINFLHGYGLNLYQSLNLIGNNPAILNLSDEFLSSIFTCLQNEGISSSKLMNFVTENPHLLQVSSEEIKSQTKWLKTVFSNKDVIKIVNTCPNVLTESTDLLMKKIQYVIFVLGLEQPQIVSSHALSYPLEHIYLRHECLRRTGHYKRPNPKSKPEMNKNPPLKMILASDDVTFTTKMAKVSLEEYETFCKLPQHQKTIIHLTSSSDVDQESDEDD